MTDSRSTADWRRAMWVCRTRSKTAHLVTTIAHPETIEVANHLIGQGDNVLTAELVHPEELMSGLLSQVLYPLLPPAPPTPKDPLSCCFSHCLTWSPGHQLPTSPQPCHRLLLPHCNRPSSVLLVPTTWCFVSEPQL